MFWNSDYKILYDWIVKKVWKKLFSINYYYYYNYILMLFSRFILTYSWSSKFAQKMFFFFFTFIHTRLQFTRLGLLFFKEYLNSPVLWALLIKKILSLYWLCCFSNLFSSSVGVNNVGTDNSECHNLCSLYVEINDNAFSVFLSIGRQKNFISFIWLRQVFNLLELLW